MIQRSHELEVQTFLSHINYLKTKSSRCHSNAMIEKKLLTVLGDMDFKSLCFPFTVGRQCCRLPSATKSSSVASRFTKEMMLLLVGVASGDWIIKVTLNSSFSCIYFKTASIKIRKKLVEDIYI